MRACARVRAQMWWKCLEGATCSRTYLRKRAHAQMWWPMPGESNLFMCLALFVYYVDKQLKGRLGNTTLHERSLDSLENVIAGYSAL